MPQIMTEEPRYIVTDDIQLPNRVSTAEENVYAEITDPGTQLHNYLYAVPHRNRSDDDVTVVDNVLYAQRNRQSHD